MRKTSPAWSFRGRSQGQITASLPLSVPGPGTYSPSTLKYDSTPSYRIGTSNRLTSHTRFLHPGPGEYSPEKTCQKPSYTVFPKAKRAEVNITTSNPGPGSYDPVRSAPSPKYKIPQANYTRTENKTPGPGQYDPKVNQNEPLFSIPKARRHSLYSEESKIPGPGSYSPANDNFQTTMYSMGKAGRYSNRDKTNPGPGSYSAYSQSGTPKYSMTSRKSRNLKESSPGPGTYSPVPVDSTIRFSVGKSDHLKSRVSELPGPGSYDISGALKKGSIIGRSNRPPLSQVLENPGPGSYDLPGTNNTPSFSMTSRRYSQSIPADPGPAQYSPACQDRAPSWKIGTESKRLQFKNFQVPGPGSYSSSETNEKKSFSFSKTKTHTIRPQVVPGPGSYEVKNLIGDLASYYK